MPARWVRGAKYSANTRRQTERKPLADARRRYDENRLLRGSTFRPALHERNRRRDRFWPNQVHLAPGGPIIRSAIPAKVSGSAGKTFGDQIRALNPPQALGAPEESCRTMST